MIKKTFLFTITAIFLILFTGCQSADNKKVLSAIEEINPNDNFYFIRGLERERSIATHIRYRGIVYSDKLKENKSISAIQIGLEDLDQLWKYVDDYERQYENALYFTEAVEPVRTKAREIFGDDIIIYNELNSWNVKGRVENFRDLKNGIQFEGHMQEQTVIDIFVDDISKINEDEFKKKSFEFYRYLYDVLKIESQMSINLRDRKYLTYEEVESRIFYLFKDEPKVQELLLEYKTNGTLTPSDMGYLMSFFTSTFGQLGDISKILFEVRNYMNTYNQVNVVFIEEWSN